ncbi:MAG: DUF882 domain-containing protein [Pseudomonadota bacterium]
MENMGASRRDVLKFGLYATCGSLLVPAAIGTAEAGVFKGSNVKNGARHVAFRNTHTGESFSGVYRVGNKYLPDAFDRINYVLRDHRTGDVFPIDPRLIDIIHTVHDMTGTNRPYDIISGYRSPKTNNKLRKASSGVAKKSLHMSGQAIDVRIPDFSTKRVRDIAKSLKAGGVGYYSRSNFVHMDTGDVRSW